MARDRGRSFSHSLLVILPFLAALTGNVASSSCQQGLKISKFWQIAKGRLPTMPADATFHHSSLFDCTRFCMELLGPRCNSLSLNIERQECRVYSNPYARLQTNQAAGYDYFFDAYQVMVNDACEKTEDCFVSNAECRAGSCQCLPRYHANLDAETCDATVVGDSCSVTADCYPANSQCQAGTCRCSSQRHYDSTSMSCNLTVVGDSCSVTADCYPANSQCQAGTCRCSSQRHYDSTSMSCNLTVVGDSCSVTADCYPANSQCQAGTCRCSSQRHYDSTSMSCNLTVVGDSCSVTADCYPANSQCQAGTCRCSSQRHYDSTSMSCNLTVVGDSCSVTADCYPANSQCQAGTCRCSSQRHYDSTSMSCNLTVVGDSCSVTADCYPANSQCQAGTCRCSSQRHYDSTSMSCNLTVVGDSCSVTADCFPANSQCQAGTCRCLNQGHYDNTSQTCIPPSCRAFKQQGQTTSGMYHLDLHDGGQPFQVYCDMDTDGGGWTVFQRRRDGSENFFLNWAAYKTGFGNVTGEHWLGNDILHSLTASGMTELRVDLKDWSNSTAFAHYSNFTVGDEASNYTLTVSGYSGTAGDALAYHTGMKFSTQDRDNDRYASSNCALDLSAAWWFNYCAHANLNGLFGKKGDSGGQYTFWYTWRQTNALAFSEMKLR